MTYHQIMARKRSKAIAKCLVKARHYDGNKQKTLDYLIDLLIVYFQEDNLAFRSDIFCKECGHSAYQVERKG